MDWCYEVVDAFGFDRGKLPPLVNSGDVVGTVSPKIAELTGLSPQTLIVAGTGDQQAGALGAGINQSGDISIVLGTAGMVIVATDEPKFEKFHNVFVAGTPNKGVYEIEGNQNSGATCFLILIFWFRPLLPSDARSTRAWKVR